MQLHLKPIGRDVVYNVRNARNKIRMLDIAELMEKGTRFPIIVIPRANDGGTQHAVCVIDDLIFDSTQTVALRLCAETWSWICSLNDGFEGVAEAYALKDKNQTQKNWTHTVRSNWKKGET